MAAYDVPVSREWRNEWRRNGAGLMTVATVAGAGYVSACQTFIVLSDGKLTHPSWWSWPFWLCLALAVTGFYAFLASYHDRLPFPGRERIVDHSTKYSLGLQNVHINLRIWTNESPEPGRNDAQTALEFVNGTQDKFLRAYLEDMNVTIAGIPPELNAYSSREIRILPRNSRLFRSPYVMRIPTGDNIRGEISYSIVYGPPSGFPAYRRTHKLGFNTRQILNPGIIDLGGVNWYDIEAEADEDLPNGAPVVSESNAQVTVESASDVASSLPIRDEEASAIREEVGPAISVSTQVSVESATDEAKMQPSDP